MTNETNLYKFWKITLPQVWPNKPSQMSVSSLFNIESCPRRWALNSAMYPDIWDSPGYPSKLDGSSVMGQIVHLVIETIIKELNHVGCSSVNDPLFVATLKKMGGYTQIINRSVKETVDKHSKNPRISHRIESVRRFIQSKESELREKAQLLISRLFLQSGIAVSQKKSTQATRGLLYKGVHAEVKLLAEDLGWVGIADVINLRDDICEIIDFKTGEPKIEHEFQIQVYSLLWLHDKQLNPTKRSANKLTLLYVTGERQVLPLTKTQLDKLEQEVVDRTKKIDDELQQETPKAKPSLQNCNFCSVRQLCEEYWLLSTQQCLAQEAKSLNQEFFDFEVNILGKRGPSSWDAVVVVSGLLKCNSKVVISSTKYLTLQTLLVPGLHVRLMGARLLNETEGDDLLPLIVLGNQSEIFILTDNH